MKIKENIPLSKLTTMRLGGPARYLIEIDDENDIPAAYEFAKNKHLPVKILGGGANTLARDSGYDGVILQYVRSGIIDASDTIAHIDETGSLTAAAGTEWDKVVEHTTERGLTGIEALSKIPGRLGAAPVQNIGAYGQDISQTFVSLRAYDSRAHKFVTLRKPDLNFTYRHSILNTTEQDRYFVTSVTLELRHGQMPRPFYNSIEQYIADHHITDFSPASIRQIVSNIRANKLPDPATVPSAGSFFKNIYLTPEQAKKAEEKGYPVHHGHDGAKLSSAWLIEQCGLKGQLIEGIRVSEKAPLVLINESATSFNDLMIARATIKQAVFTKFGYKLEQEPVEL